MATKNPDTGLSGRRAGDKDWVPVYRYAYDEAKRSLDDQTDELSGIRQRALSFLAFVGAATAFLVGTTVKGYSHTDFLFYALASAATFLILVGVILLFLVLAPIRMPWGYRVSGADLIDCWIQSEVPVPNEGTFLRTLTREYDKMRETNEAILTRIRWLYISLIVCTAVQLVLWITLTWLRA